MQNHEHFENPRTYVGEGGDENEADRLVETIARASVGGSTQKVYWSQWKTWSRLRALRGEGALAG